METSPQTVGEFSATAYSFGRELHETLGIPIGLIQATWSGTSAEAWTRRSTLESIPGLKSIFARFERLSRGIPYFGLDDTDRPGVLYNGMIAPLVPYAMKGVIWHQGEGNLGRALEYRALFPTLIRDWRKSWGQGDFPFLFVQLSSFEKPDEENDWPELREAQATALSLPKTAMAVTIDIGNGDIHPPNKRDVGRRLARKALAVAYGRDIPHSGPIYKFMRIDGGKVFLDFKHVGGGLISKGSYLGGFTIASPEKKFRKAHARIEGSRVVVWSEGVPNPAAVRYGWRPWVENSPDNPSLYNEEDFPAVSFRTDDWQGEAAPFNPEAAR